MPRLIDKSYLSFFAENGVPYKVLMTNYPVEYKSLITRINVEIDEKPLSYSVKNQVANLTKLKNFNSAYLAIIAGQYNDSVACQTALLLSLEVTKYSQSKAFYWHNITGSMADKARDDEAFIENMKKCKLLVFYGIASNSTNLKLEKLRDFINIYSHIPKIIVISGTDPLTFALKQAFIKPNLIVYFGKFGEGNA